MSVTTSYTIQMASKISGVGVHTIRAWEKRYKALEPNRDSSGHRTYTKTDVEKLMLLSELCLLGYAISKVAKMTIPDLKILLKDLGKSDESIDFPEFSLVKDKPSVNANDSINILLFALRSYKLDVIHQEVGKIKTMISSRDMALQIILPLYLELRELCSRGVFSGAQEEAVTSLLRFHAGHGMYRQHDRKEYNDQVQLNVIVVGLDNDSSDLNLMMAALLCNHYGFNYSFLGFSLSIEALGDSLEFLNTQLIVLSSANPNKNLSYIQTYIEKLMHKAPPSVEVVLNAKIDLNLEKIHSKRFIHSKSIEALDAHLSKKQIL